MNACLSRRMGVRMKGYQWAVTAGAAVLGTAALTEGIAAYFFRRTIIRQNAVTERTMKMSGTDWSIYAEKIKSLKEPVLERKHEDVFIRSKDGLKLHGTFFQKGSSKKVMIGFHGYTGKGMNDLIGVSNFYFAHGYSVLLVDERAHGDSEGKYIGFGCLDREDAMEWIRYVINETGEDCEICLHGVSMGGATVLMTSGLALPSQVKAIVSDCAFTSAWEVFAHVLRKMYHIPAAPILTAADKMVQTQAGYSLKQCNAAEEVKKAKVPILFIHGNRDTFVPCSMCYELYHACASKKDIMIVDGASHAESFYKEQERYEQKLDTFFKAIAVNAAD